MGKPTGFLEYARQGNHCQPPLERVAYWNEFHPRLGREERQRQGARCMACGVPFCQSGAVLNGMVSGCPLHNLVPEWNDLVYRRKLGRALERLLKTNDFPEFTGRVCPALCEAGLHLRPKRPAGDGEGQRAGDHRGGLGAGTHVPSAARDPHR